MQAWHKISKGIDALNQRIGQGVYWLMLVMVLIGAFNALARYAGKYIGITLTSNAFLELQWYLFAIIFLLGGAYTLLHNAHVRVDVIYDRVSPRTRNWINLVGHVIFLLPFCGFMLWMSWNPVLDSWQRLEVSPDPDGLPRYLIKTFIPLGFLLLSLQGISGIIHLVRSLTHKEVVHEETEQGHL